MRQCFFNQLLCMAILGDNKQQQQHVGTLYSIKNGGSSLLSILSANLWLTFKILRTPIDFLAISVHFQSLVRQIGTWMLRSHHKVIIMSFCKLRSFVCKKIMFLLTYTSHLDFFLDPVKQLIFCHQKLPSAYLLRDWTVLSRGLNPTNLQKLAPSSICMDRSPVNSTRPLIPNYRSPQTPVYLKKFMVRFPLKYSCWTKNSSKSSTRKKGFFVSDGFRRGGFIKLLWDPRY